MELDDFASVLANSDFFNMCSDDQKRLLAFASERRYYVGGDIVYSRGDVSRGAYVLMVGKIQAGDKSDPGVGPQTITTPGTVIGELGLVVERPRRSTVFAMSDAQLLFVPRMAFTKLLRQNPDLVAAVKNRIEGELNAFLSDLSEFSNSR